MSLFSGLGTEEVHKAGREPKLTMMEKETPKLCITPLKVSCQYEGETLRLQAIFDRPISLQNLIVALVS